MAEQLTMKDLSAAHQKTGKIIVGQVRSIADKLDVVREAVRDVAPRVMAWFKRLQVEHESLDFVGFARLIDPTVPTHGEEKNGATGYKKHKTYYALDYMRRTLVVRKGGARGRIDPATDQIARAIATVLQVLKDGDPVWAAVAKEFALSDRAVARLKVRVENCKPLIDLTGSLKPVGVTAARIVHMEPRAKAIGIAEPAADDLRRSGRRVKMAA